MPVEVTVDGLVENDENAYFRKLDIRFLLDSWKTQSKYYNQTSQSESLSDRHRIIPHSNEKVFLDKFLFKFTCSCPRST